MIEWWYDICCEEVFILINKGHEQVQSGALGLFWGYEFIGYDKRDKKIIRSSTDKAYLKYNCVELNLPLVKEFFPEFIEELMK